MPELLYDTMERCPIFVGYVKDLDSFMRNLKSICGCKDYQNDNDFIIFDSKTIPEWKYSLSDLSLFNGLIIDEICIIKNEYIDENEIYKIKIIPYIFLDSITTKEIIDLYKRLFSEQTNMNHNVFRDIYDEKKLDNFQNLYILIQYLICYSIGSYLIERLNRCYEYNFEYTPNYKKMNGFSEEYRYIRNICGYAYNDFQEVDCRNKIYEKMKGYRHNARGGKELCRSTDINYVEEEIYKSVRSNLVSLAPILLRFSGPNQRCKLYRDIMFGEKSEYIKIIPAMIKDGNVIWIEQTIIKGHLYGMKTPFDERIFFCGIYELYEKAGRDYEVFMKNYDLFMYKFHMILDLSKFFTTSLISRKTFSFLEEFFRNIKKEEFSDMIEYRKQLLKDEETKVEQKVVRNKISFILTSDDFEWA